MHPSRTLAVLLGVALLTVAPTACSTAPTPEQQRAELAARPHLSAATADLDAMLAEIRTRLSNEVGIIGWYSPDSRGEAGCYGFDDVGEAHTASTADWVHDGAIPELQWPHARAVITEVAAHHGFDIGAEPVSRPGLHAIRSTGPYGASLIFDAGDNVSMVMISGCHLPDGDTR